MLHYELTLTLHVIAENFNLKILLYIADTPASFKHLMIAILGSNM
jgi:hypothetical protein